MTNPISMREMLHGIWCAVLGNADWPAPRDRSELDVSPKAYAAFLARLDEPPDPNERLRRTMQAAPPWE